MFDALQAQFPDEDKNKLKALAKAIKKNKSLRRR